MESRSQQPTVRARSRRSVTNHHSNNVIAFILAGGLSSRMGSDKASLKLGGRSMVSIIRSVALAAGLSVRVIRQDSVPKCGPLGGILTAFKRSPRNQQFLFLACDMPFLKPVHLERLLAHSRQSGVNAVFYSHQGRVQFPFILTRETESLIRSRVAVGDFSLQGVAKALDVVRMPIGNSESGSFMNLNTPEAFAKGIKKWARRKGVSV